MSKLIKIEVKDRFENREKIQGSNHSFLGGLFREFRSFKDQIEKGHPSPKWCRFKHSRFFFFLLRCCKSACKEGKEIVMPAS